MMTNNHKMVEVRSDILNNDDVQLNIPCHDFNEDTALAVYCFIKNFVGPTSNDIDKKIEEALDEVKTQLMCAVHKEVDLLKKKVNTLEKRVVELEIENSRLKVENLLLHNCQRL